MNTDGPPASNGTGAGHGAAFFDLDRTLLRGASGRVYGEALRRVGLGPRRTGIEDVVFSIFDAIGETLPAMFITRQGVRATRGWSQAKVVEAAQWAAPHLADIIQPWAHQLFDQHREAGRPLVMATTTPHDLVAPLAEALGLDAVVATRYETRDGNYTGRVAGHYVWGRGKLDAVVEWAEDHGVDLARSYAYSDSFYDQHLLGAVGNGVAVNPDPRLALLAVARRWPVMHLDSPPGVPKFLGIEPQQVLFQLARGELFPYVRFDWDGIEALPKAGPAIIVGNHRSYFDPLAMGFLLAKAGRPVRFLGKKEVFDAPLVGDIARAMGGIRVERGSGSDEPLAAAEDALAAGELVAVMPQGTIPRGKAFFDPQLKGRWGAARLAKAAKVPVIPIGIWGTEHVWPRSSKLPHVWNVTSPPTVRLRMGPPVELKYRSLQKDTERIMAALVDLLPPEAREPHEPTQEELARTYPSGTVETDGEHESDRRPGTD
ncbi:MAG: HAD-IB family hydrolase [Microthrixaceae bacterium]